MGEKKMANEEAEQPQPQPQPWIDLVPNDVLSSVALRLPLKDLYNFQNTCKSWRSIHIESYPLGKSPLLFMYHKKDISRPQLIPSSSSTGGLDVYSPRYDRRFSLPVDPKVLDVACYSHLAYSKYGWIVSVYVNRESNLDERDIIFINPFLPSSSSIIKWRMPNFCPPLRSPFEMISMSAPPTDPSCIFLIIIDDQANNQIQIITGSDGGRKWRVDTFDIRGSVVQSVFHDGIFYLLHHSGSISMYDPSKRTCAHHRVRLMNLVIGAYSLVESEGELLGVFWRKHKDWNYIVYKLNISSMAWEGVEGLQGRSLFLDYWSTISAVGEVKRMKNKIFDTFFCKATRKNCELHRLTEGEPRLIPKPYVGLAKFSSSSRKKGLLVGSKLHGCCYMLAGSETYNGKGIWVEPNWD